MSSTAVMTLRLPKGVKQGVERMAARFGHKPAQLGARLIEEGLRRRDFPQIDLRETPAGRIAYIAGTRFAVAWVTDVVPHDMTAEAFAATYDVPAERIQAALAYARAFPAEIKSDREQSTENQKWIVVQDAAQRAMNSGKAAAKSGEKGKRAK